MKAFKPFTFFLYTLMIYLAPPLLGWGLKDLSGFFSLTPRLAYALVVALVALGIGYQAVAAPDSFKRSSEKKESRVARQSIVRWGLIGIMYVALFFIPFADRRGIGVLPELTVLRWMGVLLFAVGLGLVFWSGLALSHLYSPEVTLQEDHHLVTNGPYRIIRHPRYLGVLLMAPGLALTFRSWIGLIASTLAVAVIWFRILDEEKLMHTAFGVEWEAYCKRSWHLLPYIY